MLRIINRRMTPFVEKIMMQFDIKIFCFWRSPLPSANSAFLTVKNLSFSS